MKRHTLAAAAALLVCVCAACDPGISTPDGAAAEREGWVRWENGGTAGSGNRDGGAGETGYVADGSGDGATTASDTTTQRNGGTAGSGN
ncbi:MAG TPA: hypothetical protein VFQ45_09295 [Longimicrobium sp.]|nr:hypothetical protein [Longimicrobium sp.]